MNGLIFLFFNFIISIWFVNAVIKDDAFTQLLDDLRYNIPEPIYINDITLPTSSDGEINLSNISISGLKQFSVNNVTWYMGLVPIGFTLSIENFSICLDHKISVSVKADRNYNISSDGMARVNAERFGILMKIDLSDLANKELEDLEINFHKLEINLTNIHYVGKDISNILAERVNRQILEIKSNLWRLNDHLRYAINELLEESRSFRTIAKH